MAHDGMTITPDTLRLARSFIDSEDAKRVVELTGGQVVLARDFTPFSALPRCKAGHFLERLYTEDFDAERHHDDGYGVWDYYLALVHRGSRMPAGVDLFGPETFEKIPETTIQVVEDGVALRWTTVSTVPRFGYSGDVRVFGECQACAPVFTLHEHGPFAQSPMMALVLTFQEGTLVRSAHEDSEDRESLRSKLVSRGLDVLADDDPRVLKGKP